MTSSVVRAILNKPANVVSVAPVIDRQTYYAQHAACRLFEKASISFNRVPRDCAGVRARVLGFYCPIQFWDRYVRARTSARGGLLLSGAICWDALVVLSNCPTVRQAPRPSI